MGDKPAATPEVLHYVRDELGSVAALVDAGDPDAQPEPILPAVVERYEYDPYGRTYIENATGTRRTVSKYGNPFAWTGQRYDAGVKLHGFFARAYSPELGRWMQRDPLGFVDGVNGYKYVQSIPTRFTDPVGLGAKARRVSLSEFPVRSVRNRTRYGTNSRLCYASTGISGHEQCFGMREKPRRRPRWCYKLRNASARART